MSIFGALAFLGVFLGVFVLIWIALYLLMAYGIFKMAKNQKIEYEWLAFIPIAQLYILGKLIKSLKLLHYEIPSIEFVLPVAMVISMVLGNIPVLGFLVWIALLVLLYASLYRLFIIYKGVETAKTMLVISIISIILFGFMVPVYIFSMKDLSPLDVKV